MFATPPSVTVPLAPRVSACSWCPSARRPTTAVFITQCHVISTRRESWDGGSSYLDSSQNILNAGVSLFAHWCGALVERGAAHQPSRHHWPEGGAEGAGRRVAGCWPEGGADNRQPAAGLDQSRCRGLPALALQAHCQGEVLCDGGTDGARRCRGHAHPSCRHTQLMPTVVRL